MTFWKKVLSGEDRRFSAACLRSIAWLASQPYAGVMRLRNLGFDRGWLKSTGAPIPVISIGNLTVGGTGKTPAVAMICRYLRGKGIRVTVISRGYGAGESGRNDEAMELEMQLPDVPHVQNPDRIAAAQLAHEELDAQMLVMDDGFQHRRLKRDLEIVLLDATEPFGFGHLLPRGLLRESVSSLRRADIVIATRSDQVDDQSLAKIRSRMQRYATHCVWAEAVHRPVRLRNSTGQTQPLSLLAGKRCVLFCGIGNPGAFANTVKQAGAIIHHHLEFPDHHRYSSEDIKRIRLEIATELKDCAKEDLLVVCTGKDLAKVNIDDFDSIPLYAIDIEMELRYGRDAFEDRIDRLLVQKSIPTSNPTLEE